ncbi:glycoside hydrolase family 32 protein [Halalkalibacter lacteus]|uniref:glycoside hydrolase family 32 protein n=1 Tax=Halalkalibacter lacteus TaxID=3090663 RepID=UPI002FC9959A
MEWTREKRYRRLEEVSSKEMQELRERVGSCPWRQTYHIQPETGLLNDPNGFSYYNGEYHLFYQWFPLGPVHGLKYWYHTKSVDLVHWENVGIGIEPAKFFESHGAFSGSALEYDGKLYLFYTGNSRDENWVRHPYQCMAVMDENGTIEKFENPVIHGVPEGYTDHFRDPKIWENDKRFYAIIGAQRSNATGCVVLYESVNLKDWEFLGEVGTELQEFGFMWECPDYFELNEQGILLFSPQGLQPEGDHYQNIYQSGYLIGDRLDFTTCEFQHTEFKELDRGFDFYAPQTMVDHNNRRIVVGWMGLPEIEYPTDRHGWAHCLTLPRELILEDGKLIQRPVEELTKLRNKEVEIETHLTNERKSFDGFNGVTYELCCEFVNHDASEFGIEVRVGEQEKTTVKYDAKHNKIVFDRSLSGESFAEEYGTVRQCEFSSNKIKFQLFVDSSSIELFVNDGEEVFTGRIFPKLESKGIQVFADGGEVKMKAIKWDY